ncbi:MAG: 2Fe-2S iron-sulfur cluster binding domain-containing protein [Erysipelotrichaceae bacterium]|nr:2Fe-2S iron-sulfur cluster binding domain-containing protein [Erysipelotrichaceae bacterium]MBQ6125399.1 2Fe-2S iron-sulfur cluster binding domain-containing protein [Erysipelotrichaceae bacterium]
MNKNFLDNVPLERFAQIIPNRRRAIESAPAEFPRYEYNANVLAKKLHPKVQHVVVNDVKELNGAKLYTLCADLEKGTESLAYFQAGQYISLELTIGDSLLTRPYSLCSSPAQALKGEYQIVVKTMKNGFASEYINEHFTVGTKVDISAPEGFFSYEPLRDGKKVVGIAGGSGIAPFVSFAKAIAEGTEDFELTLLYGSRTEEEILFKEELDELQKKCDKIKVIHVLSDEEKEGYRHGFISRDLISEFLTEESSVFVCGSQGMYDYIRKETEALGLTQKRVRFDAYGEYRLTDRDAEYITKHQGKTYGLTVITNDGAVHQITARCDEPILVAIERAGIKAPSKCRSGECGWCRSKLVSGEVYTPELTEKRRQYDKVAGYIHPCCSFPCSDCVITINCEG